MEPIGAIVLDTETTGLPEYEPFRVVQVAIIDLETAEVLLDTLVNPILPGEHKINIPASATRIHHITAADVEDAPTWADVRKEIGKILSGASAVWSFNADFDEGVLHSHELAFRRAVRKQTGEDLEPMPLNRKRWHCAMESATDPWGFDPGARWVSLSRAASDAGHVWTVSGHTALGDALAARSVVLHLRQVWQAGMACRCCGATTRCPRMFEHIYAPLCAECFKVCAEAAEVLLKMPQRHRISNEHRIELVEMTLGIALADEYHKIALQVADEAYWRRRG